MKRYCELSIPQLDLMTATLSRYGMPYQQNPLASYLPMASRQNSFASYYMYIQKLLLQQQASKYAPFLQAHPFQLHPLSLPEGPVHMLKPALSSTVTQSNLLTPPLSDSGSTEKSSFTESCASPTVLLSNSLKRKLLPTDQAHNASTTTTSQRKKSKAVRKISFETNSPISGILIKPVKSAVKTTPSSTEPSPSIHKGDIDAKYNVIDISEESKRKLEAIENTIGDYICKLCRQKFEDVYQLAQHKCPSIVYIEYRCPECSKVFNCPANLASHRRWHKPKASNAKHITGQTSKQKRENNSPQHESASIKATELSPDPNYVTTSSVSDDSQLSNDAMKCKFCDESFQKLSSLGKHVSETHLEK